MRYIDIEIAANDPEVRRLIGQAEALRRRVLQAPDGQTRSELISSGRGRWVSFRQHFERIFGAKCWYTECKNPGTDDDIDHYRPKGAVAEDATHAGYWWEALNWRNFRLSCHRANRLRRSEDWWGTGGKGEHFPLLNEADRCRVPGDDPRPGASDAS